jgi:phospholipase A1
VPVPAPAASNASAPAANPAPVAQSAAAPRERGRFEADADIFQMVASSHGLTLHKPMYVLPVTYSPSYQGHNSEVLFQISLKQQLFGIPLYFAYTQKSFWEAYNSRRSAPFRETDYNPELYYRLIPADRERWLHLGMDAGFEHESNGQGLPGSRSWNRVYVAPFQQDGSHLIYWKFWWRFPENDQLPPTDPKRDDNPHIGNWYGYSELHYEQMLFGKQMAHFTFRYNPASGNGAAGLQYTVPNSAADPQFYWMLYAWQGYGESLGDYNHSVTRVGIGVALTR